MGIPKEYLAKIFDEFYQVHNPQRDRTKGLGLGLSIAKRALSLLGREITCRSESGRGTVFEFCLPWDDSSSMVSRHVAHLESRELEDNNAFVRGKRFIVVEDDQLVAHAMINLLQMMGGEVAIFHHAEEALYHADIEHADYFIVDYMLGGILNGIQLLNQLRKKLGRPIKAVLVTGDTSSSFIREAEECSWTVLHKPVDISKLVSSFKVPAS